MRLLTLLKAAALSLLLSACVAPMLAMGPGQLMWALLKPMVGLDPNTTNLFEQPVIKTRMTGLLGPHYDTTVNLLRTATELQQEGPLFYLASRYNPQEGAERAGLVWNSETNQMAALLNTGEQTKVFTESHTGRAAVWPSAMQDWLNHNSAPALLAGPEASPQAAAVAPQPLLSQALAPAAVQEKAQAPAAQAEPALGRLQAELAETRAQLQAAEQQLKRLETAPQAQSQPQEQPQAQPAEDDKEAALEAMFNGN
ncbi:hypothetical protein [Zobellella sp. An-6]|uniref:hypothetical protein n=1 Tax=Zobellella sp. An-6 TaxID=3400218 RepID=UPI004042CB6B